MAQIPQPPESEFTDHERQIIRLKRDYDQAVLEEKAALQDVLIHLKAFFLAYKRRVAIGTDRANFMDMPLPQVLDDRKTLTHFAQNLFWHGEGWAALIHGWLAAAEPPAQPAPWTPPDAQHPWATAPKA